ncbi:hypothetical protein SP15_270 [Bacillus phage SP-15]|uniref:Uncharacterized protein n=1 Tax=Bacillus phage SP-15 TaxID=1792032 RepID=A0A127AWV1_9CAUD|nr:hypothetical protein SP15_270 [Bacillus phage SP-15]AMM45077.1 hypothetical protein SP15_270 [Bacillus phage SP-15]
MEIIGQRDENTFLVQISETEGRILDLHDKLLFPAMNIDAIISKGYWEDYQGDINLEEVLPTVRDLTVEDLRSGPKDDAES